MHAVAAVGLCLLALAPPAWLTIGLLLAVGSTLMPDRVPGWWLLLVLGLTQLGREPVAGDVTFHTLLAGLHLLHVLGAIAGPLPWSGRLQLRAVVRPLRRLIAVQLCVQPLAVVALLLLSPRPGEVPGLYLLSTAALGLVVWLLARPADVRDARDAAASTDQSAAG